MRITRVEIAAGAMMSWDTDVIGGVWRAEPSGTLKANCELCDWSKESLQAPLLTSELMNHIEAEH